jgi:protein-S-isoprenylcysteine O-methyltransferase Ste14
MTGKTFLKIIAATAVFGGVHSWLASRQAKEAAARVFGQRARNGWYRLFYLAQSVVTLAALFAYLRPLPDRVLYHVRGWAAWPLYLGQAAGLAYATITAYHVGLAGILGLRPAMAFLRGEAQVVPEPEAQGPALEPDGRLRVRGPFRHSRHPLNFAPLLVFWLWPKMTAKLLIFNLASTAYLVLGSVHEESRLRAAYGETYAAYAESEVPCYVPGPREQLEAAAVLEK